MAAGTHKSKIEVGFRVPVAPPFAAMRATVAAEVSIGAASLWWPDHLLGFHAPEFWPDRSISIADLHRYGDPFICIAACADLVGEALLGVAVTDAVRRMPASLVQTAITLDHLAPGRIVLGLGAGEYANYGPYGWGVASPADRLAEAAAAIREHLDNPGPDEAGAAMGLRPDPRGSGPKFWIASHGPRGFAVTGHYGDGWFPYLIDPDEWAVGRDTIRAVAVEADRRPDAVTLGLSVNAVLADDHTTAHRFLEHPVVRVLALLFPSRWYERAGHRHPLGRSGLQSIVATLDGAELRRAADEVPSEILHEHIPHGTPAEVADHIRAHDGLQHVRLADVAATAGLTPPEASREQRAEVARLLDPSRTSG